MLIGAHQSISGGLYKALLRAKNDKCDAVQIFTKAPQTWREPELSPEDVEKFLFHRKETGINWVLVHASYLVNACSQNEQTLEKARQSLLLEAKRCDQIQADYLVFHPGSPGKQGDDVGISLVADALIEALNATDNVTFLLENTAGTGKSIGHTFEQLAKIMERVQNTNRVGICFDTCHGFAAGYDIDTVDGAAQTFEKFAQVIDIGKLKAFHLNDSKTKKGSRVDRHEKIGKGKIGPSLFKWLVNSPQFKDLPGVLETPIAQNESYAESVLALKQMVD